VFVKDVSSSKSKNASSPIEVKCKVKGENVTSKISAALGNFVGVEVGTKLDVNDFGGRELRNCVGNRVDIVFCKIVGGELCTVVGVWLGNPDGDNVGPLVGKDDGISD
jgi:hypothetical protein